MSAVTPLPHRSPTVTVEAAVERFLCQPDLGVRTVTAYSAALGRAGEDLDAGPTFGGRDGGGVARRRPRAILVRAIALKELQAALVDLDVPLLDARSGWCSRGRLRALRRSGR